MSSLNFDKLLRSLFILSTSFLPTNSCEDRDFRSSFILCESNDCNCPIPFCCPPSVLLHSPPCFSIEVYPEIVLLLLILLEEVMSDYSPQILQTIHNIDHE